MEVKIMNILIIEDDVNECENFINCIKSRNDFNLICITDSDIEGLKYTKLKRPEGIILDIELNQSKTGNINTLEFLSNLKKLNLGYNPIIVVTTHVNSKKTQDIFIRNGADIILYKNHPAYSCDTVLNTLLSLRQENPKSSLESLKEIMADSKERISEYLTHELDAIGINAKLKGREYIYSAIMYLVENKDNTNCASVSQYLEKVYGKSDRTIINGMRTAILRAWKISSIEDLSIHYTARINPETGYPTPTEFIYYYFEKIKRFS